MTDDKGRAAEGPNEQEVDQTEVEYERSMLLTTAMLSGDRPEQIIRAIDSLITAVRKEYGEENARFREALEFYATPETYNAAYEHDKCETEADEDEGKIAREALGK